ncbi:GNAT family N-acetyltransferase [Asticcacaulis sp. 201]|uniref:GNAT family N-acetyltransferase n=1 Tax=Asticcacaulis sp. 201 TaxID=3028787 RepID=UPI002915DE9D|nr:GNAT family N-acetyltransferase [Asticcacaulis sp. 201]MDV6333221.1 GNAT family N-acetyltransferase [Asticcacaulis sp. 201]
MPQTIDILRPADLTAEDAGLWNGFLALRPELTGPYFDIRYVKAIGSKVPGAAVARIREDGQVIGYFAYQLRAGRMLPMGAPLTDYHGVISAPGHHICFNAILKAARAKHLEFQGWVGPLEGPVQAASLQRRVALTPNGFDAWYQAQDGRHHKFFKNVARCERNIVKDFGGFDFSWERVTPDLLDWVIGLKRDQYRRSGLHDIFGCGWTKDLLAGLAACEASDFGLRAGVLRHEGKFVAAEISLVNATSVHLWFPAYDPAYYRYTVGIVLTMQIIRHLAPQGYVAFDFGTGGEDYKSPMTANAGECLDGSLQYSPRLGSRMIDMTGALLPLSRPRFEAVRMSLRRRVNVIRSTEVSMAGWGRAMWAMAQRGFRRLTAARA